MIKNLHYSHFLILAGTLIVGCLDDRQAGGTGTGNPTKGIVSVALQAASSEDGLLKTSAARNPDGSFSLIDAGGTPITVSTIFANVGRIKLKLPDGLDCRHADGTSCEAGEAIIPGPIIADLMTGKWQPDPGTILLPLGRYRRIDVRLEGKSQSKPGPDTGLDGHSLIIKGVFSYAGKPDRQLSIKLDFDEDVRFTSDSGLSVDTTSLNRFIIYMNVEKWLTDVDIRSCLDNGQLVLNADGNLTIDKDNPCGQFQSILKVAIRNSGTLRGRTERPLAPL